MKDSLGTISEQASTLSGISTKLDTLNSTVAQLLASQSTSTSANNA